MANKPINQLDNASGLDPTDLLVLWDSGTDTAQNMTGQQFTTWLTALAAGKGGISSITWTTSGTSGDGQYHNATIHYANGDTSTFQVRDGLKGNTGAQTYVWIAYSQSEPSSDAEVSVIPAEWMGIYVGLEATQSNLHYSDYTWYEIKGPKGDGVAYTAQTGVVGLTKTYTMYTADGTPVGSFSVTDGDGAVSTVNGIAPDGDGDVSTVVSSVEDLGLTVGSATIADAYSALQDKQVLIAPATDFAVGELPLVSGTRQTDGSVEIVKGGTDGWIEFHGRLSTIGDYRMFFTSSDAPSGDWYPVYTGNVQTSTVSPASGITFNGNYVKKVGNMVCLFFRATKTGSSADVCTIPAGFRPSTDFFMRVGTYPNGGSTPDVVPVNISTDGAVTTRASHAGEITVNATYFTV